MDNKRGLKELLSENSIDMVNEICKSSNKKPKVCIRVNKLKNSKDMLKKSLENYSQDSLNLLFLFSVINNTAFSDYINFNLSRIF